MSKKIQVSFSDRQIGMLSNLKGEFGETNADVVRSIVIAWLSEKNLISDSIKRKLKGSL